MTPDEWLENLTGKMDARRTRLYELRRYLDGDPPLPEAPEGCRDAYIALLRKARTNFAELAVESVTDRMRVSGFRVNESQEDDDAARLLWEDNRMDAVSADVHLDMIGVGEGYAMVSPGPGGVPVITGEKPEQVITDPDPVRPDVVRAGLKLYRDAEEGLDHAFLHLPGRFYRYFREVDSRGGPGAPLSQFRARGEWIATNLDGSATRDAVPRPTHLDVVPIIPFFNRKHRGEFETHTDVLDRINWTILQRLVITALQAFRQRGVSGDLPDEDEEGNPIDYADIFRSGPDALWRLPEGAEMWESAQTSIQEVLAAAKEDIRHFAAVTRTPIHILMPEGGDQSAEGAAAAREGLVFKVEDRISRATPSWQRVMRVAFAMAGEEVPQVRVNWYPAERQSLAERYDALSKAADVPWRTKMERILQFSPDEVDRMALERAEDAALAAAFTPPQLAQQQQPGEADDAAE